MVLRPSATANGRRLFAGLTSVLFVAVSFVLQTRIASAQPPFDILPGVGPVTLEGELEVLYEDYPTTARLLHFLHANNRRIPLRVAGDQAVDLPTGAYVRVIGDLADGTVTASSISTLSLATTAATTQSVLVILFNFSNNTTQPFSAATAASINDQVRRFYLENTYGRVAMSFKVAGWYTIAATNATCDYTSWATKAEAKATAAGVNLSAYSRRVFAFPKASACGWTGIGNLSGPRSWANGTYSVRTIAHEQGHNFGNHHSKSSRCASGSCSIAEYGDDRDIMGASGTVAHMNAFQKERLGWLNDATAATVHTVTTSGDYWINTYEGLAGSIKALRIWNPATSSYYYVESRAQVGFDATVRPGVTLHSVSGSISYQLDLDSVTTAYDSTLDVGQVFSNAAIGLKIQTLSTGPDGAMIRVTKGATCSVQTPTVSLTTTGTLTYTVSVRNNNSTACSASTLNLTLSVPTGWSGVFSRTSLPSISPGGKASASLTLSAPAGTVGTYSFRVTAIDASTGRSATATGSVTLVASLQVSDTARRIRGKQLPETAVQPFNLLNFATPTTWAGAAVLRKTAYVDAGSTQKLRSLIDSDRHGICLSAEPPPSEFP